MLEVAQLSKTYGEVLTDGRRSPCPAGPLGCANTTHSCCVPSPLFPAQGSTVPESLALVNRDRAVARRNEVGA